MKAALELLASVRRGELSVVELVGQQLETLHAVDHSTGAVIAFDDDQVLAHARALDDRFAAGEAPGVLHGLPITVKDWIDVVGFPCAGGSEAHQDRRPREDATVVRRLREAGAVVLAKTKVGGRAGVKHPLRPERSVGGSSSGEAAVVAGGGSILGIGSDSGGSVRLPAAWTGVIGLKPTAGLVPTTGHFPRVGSIGDGRTQIGPMARDLEAVELAVSVMCGVDGRDAGVAPVVMGRSADHTVAGVRFAVLKEEGRWSATDPFSDAIEVAASALEEAGALQVEWPLSDWLGSAYEITQKYWSRPDRTGEEVYEDLREWDRFRFRYMKGVASVDLLLTPPVREVAPEERPITGDDFVFTLPASLTGSPALVVPLMSDDVGLPVAVQVVGRPWQDALVLAAGRVVVTARRE